MKTLLTLIVAAALTAAAHADVTLNPQACNYYSPGVGTCSDATFTLMFNKTNATLVFGGSTYTSSEFTLQSVDLPMADENGATVLLTASLTYHSKAINAGRAHYYRHWYTLDYAAVTPQ
jgi:hypothetical protein